MGGGNFGVPLATLTRLLAFIALSFLVALSVPAQARITGISYTTSQPFGTHTFGSVGQYEELNGTATGELVAEEPLNAIITDIDLAPRVHGKVPYSFTFTIRRPVDLSKSNRTRCCMILPIVALRSLRVCNVSFRTRRLSVTVLWKSKASLLCGAAGRAIS